MKRAVVGLCTVLAMGLAADAAAAKKVSRAACYSAGDTLVATSQVRVFVVNPKAKPGEPPKSRYYTCNQRTKRRFLLLAGGEFKTGVHKEVLRPVITGRLVAFMRAATSVSCGGRIVVFDTKRGRIVRESSTQPSCPQSLVLSTRGFAAWTYALEFTGDFVAGLDHDGTRVLASSGEGEPSIELNSLYLTESYTSDPDVVAWVQDGQKKTAELK